MKTRVTLELNTRALSVLDSLAEEFLPEKPELTLYQWLHNTPEGRAFWNRVISERQFYSLPPKEIDKHLNREYRKYIIRPMGRPPVARARSQALNILLVHLDDAANADGIVRGMLKKLGDSCGVTEE